MEDIILIGFGGHAKSVIDTIEKQKKYKIIGFTDINKEQTYRGYSVVGTDDDLKKIFESGVQSAFITIGYLGDSSLRNKLYRELREIGYVIPVIVDDTAVLASDVVVGEGTYIGKNAVVNSAARIGEMCIINTGAIVEHDCDVQAFSHVAVGATLCGAVKVGAETLIGANASILQGVEIGERVKVGAGTVVVKNVPGNITVCGTWK